MKKEILEIDHKTAVDFILPKHYAGRTPPYLKLLDGLLTES